MALAGLLDELGRRLSVVGDRACEDVRRPSERWVGRSIRVRAASNP